MLRKGQSRKTQTYRRHETCFEQAGFLRDDIGRKQCFGITGGGHMSRGLPLDQSCTLELPELRVLEKKMYTLPTALFIWALAHFGPVHGYVARDDSSGGSTDSASSQPSFSFNIISEMTTCTPANITWLYARTANDVNLELSLAITNNGVLQPSPPPSTAVGSFPTTNPRRNSPSRRDGTVNQTINDGDIDPLLHSYTWPSVNVPAGWYIITGTLSFTAPIESSPFYVVNGPDTSCFGAAGTSSIPTSTSSGNPTSTSSGSPTSSADLPPPTLPVDAVSTSKVNRGAIAGGVIGGLAVLAAAVAAYFYIRYASASSSGGSPARRGTRKWGGLGSVDSKTKAYPNASPRSPGGGSGRHHSQSESVGPMLSQDSSVYVIGNVGIDSRPSRVNDGLEEEDEVNSYFSPSQEKISSPAHGSPLKSPFSDSGHIDDDGVPMDLISPLPGDPVTRNSSTSTSSYMNNNFSRPRSHPSSPYSPSPTSPASEAPFSTAAHNTTTSSLSHPDSSSYPPSPSPAYPSGTSADVVIAAPSPVPRRSSAGEPLSRRTPRKPVPQYNPTDPALKASPTPALPAAAALDSDSSREPSLRGGRPGPSPVPPQLNHKSSFGNDGRPVHYLIPDMPPPQRD
ncbi:hypothetical protein B0H17DRAFT_1139894 [Mycena rosella]|uniref:Uncharacterized protein n=1 Tax=Mycena rosella TaxID=1033263 RepID=A0AAD7GC07_MYCRO|nr:hypothetical protein B0H17DRAFT_1139894 [Mycena rosella]